MGERGEEGKDAQNLNHNKLVTGMQVQHRKHGQWPYNIYVDSN